MIYRLLPHFLRKVFTKPEPCDCQHVMYDYVLWNNTYEDMWYAINREHLTAFFVGGVDREYVASVNGYFVSDSLSTVVQLILDTYDPER